MTKHETTLQNPPLVEALLELKWELLEFAPGVFRDPGFSVAHQRFYDKVKEKFPFIEPLPTVQVPDELTAHVTKYRYRVGENMWPLVQLGPGIASLNFTTPYDWSTFLQYANQLLSDLVAAYEGYNLSFSSILLRYINAEPFDYEADDLLGFMETNLHTIFQPPVETSTLLKGANWMLQYELAEPEGVGTLRFTTGTSSEGTKSVIWEQMAQSTGDQVPQPDYEDNAAITAWLELAHNFVESCFFGIVDGTLLQKYKGGKHD